MFDFSPLGKAARNNAVWCDRVCVSHGLHSIWQVHLWLCPDPTPPFYPNAVTTSGEAGVHQQLQEIERLEHSGLPGAWAVKDSFHLLDLAPYGFKVLFTASWLWRAPDLPELLVNLPSARLAVVRTPSELLRWERIWAGDAAQANTGYRSIFRSRLLKDRDLLFLAAYEGQHIISGAILNDHAGVVGVSNVFAPPGREGEFWPLYINAAMNLFPGVALVGYEHGESLKTAQSCGFEVLGSLRVWQRAVTAP